MTIQHRIILSACLSILIASCGGVDDDDPSLTACVTDTWSHQYLIDNTTSAGQNIDTLDVTYTFRPDGTARLTLKKDEINWDDVFRDDSSDFFDNVVGGWAGLAELGLESYANLSVDGYYVSEGEWSVDESNEKLTTRFPEESGYSAWSEYFAASDFNSNYSGAQGAPVTVPVRCQSGKLVYDVLRKNTDDGSIVGQWSNSVADFTVSQDIETRGAVVEVDGFQRQSYKLDYSTAGYQMTGCKVTRPDSRLLIKNYPGAVNAFNLTGNQASFTDLGMSGSEFRFLEVRNDKAIYVNYDDQLVMRNLQNNNENILHTPSSIRKATAIDQFNGGVYYQYQVTAYDDNIVVAYDSGSTADTGAQPAYAFLSDTVIPHAFDGFVIQNRYDPKLVDLSDMSTSRLYPTDRGVIDNHMDDYRSATGEYFSVTSSVQPVTGNREIWIWSLASAGSTVDTSRELLLEPYASTNFQDARILGVSATHFLVSTRLDRQITQTYSVNRTTGQKTLVALPAGVAPWDLKLVTAGRQPGEFYVTVRESDVLGYIAGDGSYSEEIAAGQYGTLRGISEETGRTIVSWDGAAFVIENGNLSRILELDSILSTVAYGWTFGFNGDIYYSDDHQLFRLENGELNALTSVRENLFDSIEAYPEKGYFLLRTWDAVEGWERVLVTPQSSSAQFLETLPVYRLSSEIDFTGNSGSAVTLQTTETACSHLAYPLVKDDNNLWYESDLAAIPGQIIFTN